MNNSAAVAERIADEGEVLLKNDGLLPLTSETPVTPLGYRYLSPLMSGSGSGSTDTTRQASDTVKKWLDYNYATVDLGNCPNDNVAVNRMVRAGTDQHMLDMTLSPGSYTSLDTPTGVQALRTAIKNTLYTLVNSAKFNGAVPGAKVYYSMSPWRIAVIVIDIVIALGIFYGVAVNILRTRDAKTHPKRYKSSGKRNKKKSTE